MSWLAFDRAPDAEDLTDQVGASEGDLSRHDSPEAPPDQGNRAAALLMQFRNSVNQPPLSRSRYPGAPVTAQAPPANGGEPFPMASTMKIAVAAAYSTRQSRSISEASL